MKVGDRRDLLDHCFSPTTLLAPVKAGANYPLEWDQLDATFHFNQNSNPLWDFISHRDKDNVREGKGTFVQIDPPLAFAGLLFMLCFLMLSPILSDLSGRLMPFPQRGYYRDK